MDSFSANSRSTANDNQTSGTEAPERNGNLQERPQLALILEMEDHERRREAIRKQRSNMTPLSNYADEDLAPMGGSRDRLHNLIEDVMGDPTFKQNIYSSIRHHVCAKAA